MSVVNSTWRALARPEYLQELLLPTSRSMNEALQSLDERSTRRVKSIWLRTRQSYNSEELKGAQVYSIKIPQSVDKMVISNLRLELCDAPFYTGQLTRARLSYFASQLWLTLLFLPFSRS